MQNSFASEVFYKEQIDLSFADKEKDLLIIDTAVLPFFKSHLEGWKYIYPVEGGEALKELTLASKHIEAICTAWGLLAHRHSRVLVCGGGSVGDFGGFVASILKRGVRLVQIPTTWLSSIDSAHGGKTALNVAGIKNQVGTFYPAEQVHIFKEILFKQPHERAVDGFGESFKMVLLENGKIQESIFLNAAPKLEDLLWSTLSVVVDKKYDVVKQDPYETKGLRKILNLGHTLGHALEASTKQSHGLCVLQGLIFSLRWSQEKGFIASDFVNKLILFIKKYQIPIWEEDSNRPTFHADTLKNLALADKKSLGKNELDFVFVKNEGNVFCEKVTVDDFIAEAKRQGWIK